MVCKKEVFRNAPRSQMETTFLHFLAMFSRAGRPRPAFHPHPFRRFRAAKRFPWFSMLASFPRPIHFPAAGARTSQANTNLRRAGGLRRGKMSHPRKGGHTPGCFPAPWARLWEVRFLIAPRVSGGRMVRFRGWGEASPPIRARGGRMGGTGREAPLCRTQAIFPTIGKIILIFSNHWKNACGEGGFVWAGSGGFGWRAKGA